MKSGRKPARIPPVLPGTDELDDAPDRAIEQWRQLRAWYDSRLSTVRTQATTAQELLEAHGALADEAVGATGGPDPFRTRLVSLGPARARRVVVLATTAALSAETSAWIAAAASGGVRVLIPGFVRRTHRGALPRRLHKDRRHILHRLAFPLGRTLVGLEAGAIARILAAAGSRERVLLVGIDDGIRSARLAALLAGDAAGLELVVSRSESAPAPIAGGPIDRLVFAQAEIGAPERWPTGSVPVHVVPETLVGETVLERLAIERVPVAELDLERRIGRAASATFGTWLGALRSATASADQTRADRAGLVRTPARERAAAAGAIREALRVSVEGRAALTVGDRRPVRTRRVRVTARFVAYEVTVDTGVGLDAWGQLLVPRDARSPAAAVVAQHGLGGSPGDVTGIDAALPPDVDAYHAFGAELADRGYVVFAPYLTVPEPQAALLNPLVVAATSLGEQRSRSELIKLRAIIDWLTTLPFVRPDRIGYYGLSYGGHAALWIAGLDERIRAVVVSGHANDWTAKTTDLDDPRSFMAHPDEDFTVWEGTRRFSHLELIAAAWPRPTLIEAGTEDPITKDAWFGRIERELKDWSSEWRTPDRLEIDRFVGVHEVTGAASFEFLDRWLRPERRFIRDYEYRLPPARDLPGIGDISSDLDPFISRIVPVGASLEVAIPNGRRTTFRGAAFRLSSAGDPGELIGVRVGYRTTTGRELGEVLIDGRQIHALWDLWHEAPIPPRGVAVDVIASIVPIGSGPGVVVYGPKALGRHDRRLRPAVRPVGFRGTGEPTHEFARALLDGPREDFAWRARSRPSMTFRVASSTDHPIAARWVAEALAPIATQVASGGDIVVELGVDPTLAAGPRSHRIEISAGSIRLAGKSRSGLLMAANTLRQRVSSDRALQPATIDRSEHVPDRVTTGVMPAGTRYRETDLPSTWTDGALERVAKSGFTGIWTWVNLEDVTLGSTAIPELNDPTAAERIARVQSVSERAAAFGLDTWIYLAIGYRRPPSAEFWARHPELRGGDGWIGPTFCSSNPVTIEHYRQVVEQLLRRAPGVSGIFVIFDIEGFYFCGSEEEARLACPRCRSRSPEDLAREVLGSLDEAVRAASGGHRLVAWSYGWRPDWVERLVPTLPASIEFQADFSKGTPVVRGGIESPAGDDTIAEVGPSPVFERLREASAGRRFWAKGEHAISLDAIFLPYLPGLDQFAARAAAMRASGAVGWFANWMHYGFLEPLTAELLNRHAFDPPPDDTFLTELAASRYGPSAAELAREAWTSLSRALRAFPYSDPVARSPGPFQKGPTNPIALDRLPAAGGRWRSWQNDLAWTAPFGADIVRDAFEDVVRHQRRGLSALRRARLVTDGPDRRRLERDIDLVTIWMSAAQTMVAVIDATQARERGDIAAVLEVAECQRGRLGNWMRILERDSRLGFAQDGGGVIRGGLFTPRLLEVSLGMIDDLLAPGPTS